jgi:hypothetical protein
VGGEDLPAGGVVEGDDTGCCCGRVWRLAGQEEGTGGGRTIDGAGAAYYRLNRIRRISALFAC